MNLLYGEIVKIYDGAWTKMARVRVGRAYTQVALEFLPEAKEGHHILFECGFAIAFVGNVENKES